VTFSGRCEVLLGKGEFLASFPGLTIASFTWHSKQATAGHTVAGLHFALPGNHCSTVEFEEFGQI
jgi:hypothetical protein